jgi:hypothetical protein
MAILPIHVAPFPMAISDPAHAPINQPSQQQHP